MKAKVISILALLLMVTQWAWAATNTHAARGNVDDATSNLYGSIYLGGWALDDDCPSASTQVDIYVYSNSARTDAYKVKAVTVDANMYRNDLAGKHGFSVHIAMPNTSETTYYTRVYAIHYDSDGKRLTGGTIIGEHTVTVKAPLTVSYNANGGTGAPSAQYKRTGINLTLSSTKPTHAYCTFAGWNTKADGTGTNYAAGATYTANAAATLYAKWPPNMSKDASGAYTIGNKANWELFCNLVNSGYTFSSETVKMTADISDAVTTMVGSGSNSFKGTFDGQGHTLNVNVTSETPAPFLTVTDCTIKNLHITGQVVSTRTGSADHTSGLIKSPNGTITIENVRVSATVKGYQYFGGFIGHGASSTINMTGCVFDGKLEEKSAGSGNVEHVGGFIGWGGKMTITMTDCLFAGTYSIAGSGSGHHNFHPVAYYYANGVTATLTTQHVYYTVDPSTQSPINSGTALPGDALVYSISKGTDVTSLAISGDPVKNYTTSGLKRFSAGIMLDELCLAAGGNINIPLTLTHTDVAAGYTFGGYTASAGTLSGTTLTMPNANVTINATYNAITPSPRPSALTPPASQPSASPPSSNSTRQTSPPMAS